MNIYYVNLASGVQRCLIIDLLMMCVSFFVSSILTEEKVDKMEVYISYQYSIMD